MSKSPEQFNTYSEEQALEEAQRMQKKISKGDANDYKEAAIQIGEEDAKLISESELKTLEKESVILEKRPTYDEIIDPRIMDLPATPDSVQWKDARTGEIFTAYPAVCHDVRSSKGYMVDRWIIKWFDDPDEAKNVDLEARKEADSYVMARKIYAELTKGAKEGELPLKTPERWNELSPQEILSMAGFSEDQYHIHNDVGHWFRVGEEGYRSEGESWDGVSPSATLANKNKEGVWEIGNLGLSNMFEGQSVHVKAFYGGERGGWVETKSVLSEMGVPDEKIISIKTQIQTKKEKTEADFNAGLKEFVEEVKKLPAFSCLPQSTQEKIDKLGNDYYVEDISLVAEELRKELGVAEKLYSLKEQGEILVNWGGHFRKMGSTGQRDFWVVRPDGTLRNSEDIRYHGRYTSQGDKYWRVVAPEELALTYYSANSGDKAHCEVIKSPADGVNQAQVEQAHIIEQELRANINAFGLNSEIIQKERVRLESIKNVYDHLPKDLKSPDGWKEEWSFQDIMSDVDVILNDNSTVPIRERKENKFTSRIDYAKVSYSENFTGKERGRQVIYHEPCADGMLEMVAYEKWGGWQLAMRWRELDESEKAQQKTISSDSKSRKTLTDESLANLLSKFNKK